MVNLCSEVYCGVNRPLFSRVLRFYSFFYLFFAFVPWLSFGLGEGGIQPYSLVLSFPFVLYAFYVRIPFFCLLLLLFSLSSLFVVLCYSVYDFLSLRALLTYSSPFFHAFSLWFCVKYLGVDLRRMVYFFIFLFFLVGLLQKFFSVDFSGFLHSQTSVGRGVTSLTPEPTFFGMYMLLMLFLLMILEGFKISLGVFLSLFLVVFSLFFLSLSSMALLYFFIVFLGLFFFVGGKKVVVLLICCFLLFFVVFLNFDYFFKGTRVFVLYNAAIENPLLLIQDESVNDRLRSVFFPLVGAFDSILFPQGYHQYGYFSSELRLLYPVFYAGGEGDKIMSGLAAPVFELGFLSLFLFLAVLVASGFWWSRFSFFIVFVVFSVFFSALTLSIPIFGFILSATYLNRIDEHSG